MTGLLPFRSLNSVMVVTLHVAVVSCVLRSFLRPESPAASVAVWVPLSILVSLFLSMPMGRAIAGAFEPGVRPSVRICPRCEVGELRPLLRAGAGLFAPISGHRCAGCGTTFRAVGEDIIQESASDRGAPADPEGVRFLGDSPGGSGEPSGIRFLDEPEPSRPALDVPANIPGRAVSGP